MAKQSAKIKFTAYVGTSIDGIIAKSSTSSNKWASKEDQKFFKNALWKHDIFIVGRNTYRITKKSLDKRNTLVITSKVSKPKQSGSVTFFNPARTNIIDFLHKNKYKKPTILGGGAVYNYFLEHKMLNILWVTIEPYVFTSGVRMFAGNIFKMHKFILLSVKKLNKRGTLLLKYKNAN